MKTILFNFLSTLKKYKLASTLNIIGLAVAFAALIVMMAQIRHELSYDRVFTDADRIFRIEGTNLDTNDPVPSALHSQPFVENFIESSPHIEAGTLFMFYFGQQNYTVGGADGETAFQHDFIATLPATASLFEFNMLEGAVNVLDDPDKVIIPASVAGHLFPNESAVGKVLHMKDKLWGTDAPTITVGGVYADLPKNTRIPNAIYHKISPSTHTGRNFHAYVKLDSPQNAQAVLDNFKANYHKENQNYAENLMLRPISEIYFSMTAQDHGEKGDKKTTAILMLTAFLVVLIAGINFTNFSTSLAPVRIRNINTQKVLGNTSGRIRMQLISEALGLSLFAYLLAVGIVGILSLTSFIQLLSADFSVRALSPILWMGLGSSVLIGGLAGLYPAWYMTSFQPAMVLRGNFGLSPQGHTLRTGLISLQYVISIVLIIVTLFVRLQNDFFLHRSLGFDTDEIAVVKLGDLFYEKHHQAFKEQVEASPDLTDVAFSSQKFGGESSFESSFMEKRNQKMFYEMVVVSPNFPEVMGIPMAEGRGFLENDARLENTDSYIVNKQFSTQYDVNLENLYAHGRTIQVVGIHSDVHFGPLKRTISPFALVINGGNDRNKPYAYVKIASGTPVRKAIRQIQAAIHRLDPTLIADIELFDDIKQGIYAKELRLSQLVTIFCLLAVLISLMGVFGLVIFETQYRRKEIGIRKVYGATITEILALFNSKYIRIVLGCFVIAAPIAFYFVREWLKGFPYRIVIHPWVFGIALLAILTITVFTVTIQSYRAASENPADAVR